MSKRVSVGQLIKEARERRGMTQHELGAKLGMRTIESSQVQISRYENDVFRPPTATLVRIARILKIPIGKVTATVLKDEARRLKDATKGV